MTSSGSASIGTKDRMLAALSLLIARSDRTKIYQEHAERLLSEGKAYLCFCSAEELEAERQKAIAEHRPPIYSGKCRKLDPAEALKRRAGGEACRHPPAHSRAARSAFTTLCTARSNSRTKSSATRSSCVRSGMPVYNYVVVIDDALMKITHVIRGDDHLSNTPKQVAVYEALGWPVPEFAHLSTILGPDRERLIKRHGATSVANFREMGVLPEALVNYMALLGWAPSGGDREIFTPQELVKEFRLERVTPSPAVFDIEKLYWLNRHYIKEAPRDRILPLAASHLEKAGYLKGLVAQAPSPVHDWLGKLLDLLLPSVDRLEQLPDARRVHLQLRSKGCARRIPTTPKCCHRPKLQPSSKPLRSVFPKTRHSQPSSSKPSSTK